MHIYLSLLQVKQSTELGSLTPFCKGLFKRKEKKISFLNSLCSLAVACNVVNSVGVKLGGRKVLPWEMPDLQSFSNSLFVPSSPHNLMHCDCLANVLGALLRYNIHLLITYSKLATASNCGRWPVLGTEEKGTGRIAQTDSRPPEKNWEIGNAGHNLK